MAGRSATGGHPDLGHVEVEEAFAQQGGGPPVHRLGGVEVAVGVGTGHAAEQRARPDPSAVELDGA